MSDTQPISTTAAGPASSAKEVLPPSAADGKTQASVVKKTAPKSDYKPADVDTAQLYDGFSVLTIVWLEAMGFCGRGESGPFIEGGANIARDGLLPLNTAGGQLSGGRLHGFSLIHEACVQLWGRGGGRQVQGAKTALVACGGYGFGAMLLRTD